MPTLDSVRARSFVALSAIGALGASTRSSSAATWEVRDAAFDLAIDVGAPDAEVCVVHPKALRSEAACAGLDLGAVADARDDQRVAIVRSSAWSGAELHVTIGVSDAFAGDEWTAREARAARDSIAKAYAAPRADGARVAVGPAAEVRLRGAQAFVIRAIAEHPDGRRILERRYVVVGRSGTAAISFAFDESAKDELSPVVDAIVASIAVPKARSVTARVARAAGSVAAPIPIAVLAAVDVARRRKEKQA